MTCERCGHAEETHAQPTLFAPARCLHKFWATDEPCKCEGFLSVEDAEREAIKGEAE